MPTKLKTVDEVDAKPTGTDELANDVDAETLTYPPGTPNLLPILKLPRMRRVEAYRALGKIAEQQRSTSPDDTPPPVDDDEQRPETDEAPATPEIDITELADRYLVVALIEEYLAVVAEREDIFRAWAVSVDDTDLVKVFNVYTRKSQPGEAKSSTG